jgi:hypothetical protein
MAFMRVSPIKRSRRFTMQDSTLLRPPVWSDAGWEKVAQVEEKLPMMIEEKSCYSQ